MSKIFLVGSQDWETTDKNTGEKVTGKSYIGFLKSGSPIKFTCNEVRIVFPGEVEFDEVRAAEIPLRTKLFGGRTSYQCANCYGKEAS